jgi:hypothetical protein
MLTNPWVWIIALIIVGAVVALAIWRGRGAEVTVGLRGLRLSTPQEEAPDRIDVAANADIGGEVGKVRGRVGDGSARPADIGVANGMVVRSGAKVEEITGETISSRVTDAGRRKADR